MQKIKMTVKQFSRNLTMWEPSFPSKISLRKEETNFKCKRTQEYYVHMPLLKNLLEDELHPRANWESFLRKRTNGEHLMTSLTAEQRQM